MKAKNLTRRMKDFVSSKKGGNLNPDEWQFTKNTPDILEIINKDTKEVKTFNKSDFENIWF